MTNTPTPEKEELLAINRDFRNLPDVPSRETLWFFARMSGVTKWPDDWERGKKLQREYPGAIPAKTELELAAGLWNRIATALRTPRLGETGDDDVVERLERLRERCAQAAERRGEQYYEPVQSDYDRRDGCYDAAAAIRQVDVGGEGVG